VLADTILAIGSNQELAKYKGVRPECDRTVIPIKLFSWFKFKMDM
jgi:hypothetical protein